MSQTAITPHTGVGARQPSVAGGVPPNSAPLLSAGAVCQSRSAAALPLRPTQWVPAQRELREYGRGFEQLWPGVWPGGRGLIQNGPVCMRLSHPWPPRSLFEPIWRLLSFLHSPGQRCWKHCPRVVHRPGIVLVVPHIVHRPLVVHSLHVIEHGIKEFIVIVVPCVLKLLLSPPTIGLDRYFCTILSGKYPVLRC